MKPALIFLGVFLAAPAAALAQDNAACLACHGNLPGRAFVDSGRFRSSVHGELACIACHANIAETPHEISPAAGLPWQQVPETCGQCHSVELEAYRRGVHGQAAAAGKRDAPICTDCHGEHSITSVKEATSRVAPARIPETCGQCHAAERITTRYRLPTHVVGTYMESVHGLALRMGSVTVANCASCHGVHEILPSTHPASPIHPANLAKTCGQCHAGVGPRLAQGKVHSGMEARWEHPAVSWVRRFYWALILLVIGGMLLHNALDFTRKLRAHGRRSLSEGRPGRLTPSERIQHGALIVAFLLLAYTGFALKFPQAWWAAPFLGRFDLRTAGHRGAAALFVMLAVTHAWFMLFTRRGRENLKALAIRREDFSDAWKAIRGKRPRFGRFGYVEKLEYWALVWGSVVMTVTGGLLVGRDATFRWLPKWGIDVLVAVHYYEAILACLAIAVWHFYFVIFDPEEYPMKWSWLTGRSSAADSARRTEP